MLLEGGLEPLAHVLDGHLPSEMLLAALRQDVDRPLVKDAQIFNARGDGDEDQIHSRGIRTVVG